MSSLTVRRNLMFYVAYQAMRFLFPIVITPFLAHTLGPPNFADFVIWNACVWTAALLVEFGFYIYAINVVATASETERPDVVSGIVTAKLALLPVAIIAYLAGTWGLGLLDRQPLAVTVGIVALIGYGCSFAWYFQGMQRGGTAVLIEALPQAAQFGLTFLLIQGPGDIWVAAALQSGAAAAALTASMWIIRREAGRFRWNWTAAKRFQREAVPYFVERVSYTLYATATPILISIFSTAQQAGYYGLAEKVNGLLTVTIGPLTQAFAPVVARRIGQERPDWSLSLKIVTAGTALTAVGAVVVFVSIGVALPVVVGEAYRPAVPVARWFCMVAIFLMFQLSLANMILIPAGRSQIFMRTSVGMLIVSMVAQALLVPRYGAEGSVIARLLCEILIGLIFSYTIFKMLRANRTPSADA